MLELKFFSSIPSYALGLTISIEWSDNYTVTNSLVIKRLLLLKQKELPFLSVNKVSCCLKFLICTI